MVRRYLVTLAACVVAAVLVVPAPVAHAQDEDVNALFQQGLSAFKQGYYGYNISNVPGRTRGAMYYFERVKRAIGGVNDPSDRAARASLMLSEASRGEMIRMLSIQHNDPAIQAELRGFARWLLNTATDPRWERAFEPENITTAVRRAMLDSNAESRLQWMETVRIRYGEFAVPEIHQQYLHCGNPELMGRATLLLTMLGRDAVMPLLAIIRHFGDSSRAGGDRIARLDRMHAAQVLGDIGDSRAVPALMERLQDPQEDREVKQNCALALEKILGPIRTSGDMIPAYELYYSMALKYYHQLPELMYGRTDSFAVWYWVPNDADNPLAGGYLDFDEKIPIWAYMDIHAEQACLDALQLKPDHAEAWDLLVDVNLRQYLEARARLHYASDIERERFAGVFERSHRGLVLGAPAGQAAIYRAIQRALRDRLPEVAIAAIEKLIEVGDHRFVPKANEYDPTTGQIRSAGAPLIEALTYDDKRVRYAAAQALFTLNNNRIRYRDPSNPTRLVEFQGFFGIETARDVLIQGLGESSQRTILVITNNLDLKNDMRQKLESLGYYVYFADSPTEGIQRALSFPTDDLILLDAEIANTPIRTVMASRDQFRGREVQRSETIFDILTDDFRTAGIPIALMYNPQRHNENDLRDRFADAFQKQQIQGTLRLHGNGNAISPMEADLGLFQDIWRRKADDSKNRANAIAIKCAAAIRAWDPDRAPAGFFDPVILALVARVGDNRKNTAVKVAMLQTLEQFCQAKDDTLYPVSFWNDNVIPNILLVLNSAPEIDEPIVKYWACKVLSAVYLNRLEGAKWTPPNFDPRTVTEDQRQQQRSQNPFWALFYLLDWNPPVEDRDDDADGDVDAWEARWIADVLAVREAAGEVMGSVNMSDVERFYVYRHKRVNLPRPNHYDPNR